MVKPQSEYLLNLQSNENLELKAPNNSAKTAGSQAISLKLAHIESSIKQKFANIRSLTSLLDQILGEQNSNKPALLPKLMSNQKGMEKIFTDMRSVMSKLKIELRQDYQKLAKVIAQQKDANESLIMTSYDRAQGFDKLSKAHQLTNALSVPNMANLHDNSSRVVFSPANGLSTEREPILLHKI